LTYPSPIARIAPVDAAIGRHMIFIESPAFTEDVKKLLSDQSYAYLQQHLTRRGSRTI
jgi:hypothetical protein